jgi:ubiquinone biosynthesis protein
MQEISGFLTGLVGVVATVVMLGLLAATSRRVMGAPVGWVRAAVVSFLTLSAASGALTYGLASNGWVTDAGDLTVHPAVALAAVVLTFAWAYVLGLCVLLVLELLVPTGAVPGPWRAFQGLRQGRRESRRYAQILAIGTRHGLGGTLRRGARDADGVRMSRTDERRLAAGLRDTLGDAGVTFVKFGQVLSTRRDLLSPTVADALASLQSEVPPAPWADVEAAVVAALGRPIEEVFDEFSPEPLASASVGQVHVARLPGGREVVVKVQRPGARDQVEVDLAILRRLARRLERDTAWGRTLGVVGLAEGFADMLHEELDYRREAENTIALRATLEPPAPGATAPVVVPDVDLDLSGPTLLVMDRLAGEPVGRAETVLARFDAGRRAELAGSLLAVALRQVLVAGTFHADLHPGNVLVSADGTIGLLDMGAVGRLGEPERLGIAALLLAIDGDDAVAATDALLELLEPPGGLDARRLERSVGQLLLRSRSGAAVDASFAALFRLVTDAGCAVPANVAAAFRTFTSLEGTLRRISPGFDLIAGAREATRPLVEEYTTFGAVRRKVTQQLVGLAPEVERFPRRVTRLVTDLEQGRFTVQVRAFADPSDRAFVTSLVQQVVATFVASSAVVAAVLLMVAEGGPQLGDGVALFPVLGALLGFAGTVLGVRVLVFAFRGLPAR